MTDDDLESAWAAIHDATPPGWYVGQPSYHIERAEWVQYAFDPREVPKVGVGGGLSLAPSLGTADYRAE